MEGLDVVSRTPSQRTSSEFDVRRIPAAGMTAVGGATTATNVCTPAWAAKATLHSRPMPQAPTIALVVTSNISLAHGVSLTASPDLATKMVEAPAATMLLSADS